MFQIWNNYGGHSANMFRRRIGCDARWSISRENEGGKGFQVFDLVVDHFGWDHADDIYDETFMQKELESEQFELAREGVCLHIGSFPDGPRSGESSWALSHFLQRRKFGG